MRLAYTYSVAFLITVACTSPAADSKPDEADKVITEAIATLKSKVEKANEIERRKLTAAIEVLEDVLKVPLKSDNILLVDFVDNPSKYEKQNFTFILKVPGSPTPCSVPLNQWMGDESIDFTARVGEPAVNVKVDVYVERGIILKSPAIQPGDPALVSITYDAKRSRWKAIAIKRP